MAISLASCLLLIFLFAQALSVPHFLHPSASESSDEKEGTIWVVLVAGSKGWWNYRHQADVCHAWHLMVDNGVNPDNIITMMYDDIANHVDNPYPGKIFNHPNGTDVYEGVRIDYKGEDVHPQNFMAVLLGNETATDGKPVLKSTKTDKVFIYYTDHGSSGEVIFPSRSNSLLTVKSLMETLKGMQEKGMYKELTFYLEACESGPMFEGQLWNNSNIYAVTAANATEESWACHCFTEFLPSACLGDLFSVNWMEDTAKGNLHGRTLAEQFEFVKEKTKNPPGEMMAGIGSNVLAFGDLNIQKKYLSEFMDNGKAPANSSKNMELEYPSMDLAVYPARDIPMVLAQQQKNGMKMHTLLKNRRYLEEQMNELVNKVLQQEDPSIANRDRAFSADPLPQGITQLECHHQVMHAFNDKCFNFAKSPYALKYSYMLTNLCEMGIDEERIKSTIQEHCANLDSELEIL